MANSNVANKQVNTDITVEEAIKNIDRKKANLEQFANLSRSVSGGGNSNGGGTLNCFDPSEVGNIDWPFLTECCYWGYVQYCLDHDLEVGKANVSDKDIQATCVIKTEQRTNTAGKPLEGKYNYTYKNLKTGETKISRPEVKKHLTATDYKARLNLVLKRS